MSIEQFEEMALSFPGTVAAAHFDRVAFKVVNKRIFATLHEESGVANLKFSAAEQSVFCSVNKKAAYPVAKKWGLQGWTSFELKKMDKAPMLDALDTAYKDVLKKR